MASTSAEQCAAQTVQHWQRVGSLLLSLGDSDLDQPARLTFAKQLQEELATIRVAGPLTSPHITCIWTELLQQQVPCNVLAAWCKAHTGPTPASFSRYEGIVVLLAAQQLLGSAFADLPAASSSSNLSGVMKQQIEQSGFLQQLPGLLTSAAGIVEAAIEPENHGGCLDPLVWQHASTVLLVFHNVVEKLYPGFITSHAAGQQCIVPAMQLGLVSLQCISKAVQQGADRKRLELWLRTVSSGVFHAADAASAAASLINIGGSSSSSGSGGGGGGGGGGGSSGTSGTSTSSNSSAGAASAYAAALAVTEAQATADWFCLWSVVAMLLPFVQQAGSNTADRSSSSSWVGDDSPDHPNSSQSAASSETSSHSTGDQQQEQQQQQDWGTHTASTPWLPAVLAPSMPAAYSAVLDQLGCSREVALWWAGMMSDGLVAAGGAAAAPADGRRLADKVHTAAFHFLLPLTALLSARVQHELDSQPSAKYISLYTSVAAATLQFLSDSPPAVVRSMAQQGMLGMDVVFMAWANSHMLIAQQQQQQQQQQQEQQEQQGQQQQQQEAEWAGQGFVAARMRCCELATPVLGMLLEASRAMPDSPSAELLLLQLSQLDSSSNSSSADASAHASSPSAGSSSSAARTGLPAGSRSAEAGVHPTAYLARACRMLLCVQTKILQMNETVGIPHYCLLLQDYVRLTVAVPVPVAEGVSVPEGRSDLTLVCQMLMYLCNWDSSRLVDAVVTSGDLASSGSQQLYGLLCSLLKASSIAASSSSSSSCSSQPGSAVDAGSFPALDAVKIVTMVTTAVLSAATSSTGRVDPQPSQQHSHPPAAGAGALQAQDAAPSSSSTSACTDVLPWLVLLGRCCMAAAVTMQNSNAEQRRAFAMQGLLATTVVRQWLRAGDTAQQLTVMGYDPGALPPQLLKAEPVLALLMFADDQALEEGHTSVMLSSEQLRCIESVGRALSCFAVPDACNNPACSNVSGPSEAQLVAECSCACAGCKTAPYCSRLCQQQHWEQHRPVCKALAAAAAEAASIAQQGQD